MFAATRRSPPNRRRAGAGAAGGARDSRVIEPMAAAMNAKIAPRSFRCAWLARILSCALPLAAIAPAAAATPDPAEFYKGKTITLITSTGVGGTYDVIARLVARFMPRYIPGNPSIVVQNMPGGGNVLATNFIYGIAPKDGTAIATIHSAMPLRQVLDSQGIRYDADRFNWLGSTGPQNEVILVWHSAGIRTIADATAREVVVGGTGTGSGMVIIPTMMNNLLGTKFKIVSGYRTSEEVNFGMERGEVQARAFSFGSITSQHPDWLTEHKVTFIAQEGARREKLLPDVPLLTELAKSDEQRRIFQLVSSAPALGQPYVAPPDLPADRLAALRSAFAATLKDAAFLAETAKMRFAIDPMSGDEVAQIARETIHAPPDIIAKAKAAMGMADR
jgi:tripartite-type tricarboxylate transporter receptor subunit TctC